MSSAADTPNVDSIYRDHNSWLRGWLRQRLDCSETAADLAQDTFLRLLGRPGGFEASSYGRTRAYLATVARGLCVDLWRRRDIEKAWLEALASRPEEVQPSEEQRYLVIETLLSFNAMLRQLPEQVAETFILSQIQGLTYKEIALKFEVTERTVKNYMARAMLHCTVNMPNDYPVEINSLEPSGHE